MTHQITRIISMDDHVIEPPHVWQTRLPAKHRGHGPPVVRDGYPTEVSNGNQGVRQGGDRPPAAWEVWRAFRWAHT